MFQPRVIPCLLIQDGALVKTVQFEDPAYVGDPANALRIFNDKEVDELVLLDISATSNNTEPNLKLITQLASECFMPLAYGGGIRCLETAARIMRAGVEKLIINTMAHDVPEFVSGAARRFGSQAVVVSIDVRRADSGYEVFTNSGQRPTGLHPIEFAQLMEQRGAGEILLTSIDREGTMTGYDLELIESCSAAVDIPVIANGGAGKTQDFGEAIHSAGASAASAGSLVVFFGRQKAVLINFPPRKRLDRILNAA